MSKSHFKVETRRLRCGSRLNVWVADGSPWWGYVLRAACCTRRLFAGVAADRATGRAHTLGPNTVTVFQRTAEVPVPDPPRRECKNAVCVPGGCVESGVSLVAHREQSLGHESDAASRLISCPFVSPRSGFHTQDRVSKHMLSSCALHYGMMRHTP